MLTVLALTMCALSGLGCTDEDSTAPRQAAQEVAANTLVVADTLCAKLQFTITSPTAVTTSFPNRTTCGAAGLVLIRGQAATWAQSPNRRLTLFVRLLNKSGQTLQMPVRLYLPSTGITVVAPAGTPASKVVPLNPDSVEAGGGKIWFVGGTGTLAANDSTVQDTIRVNVMSPVTQARFSFQASALVAGGPLPPIPNSFAVPDDSLLTIRDPVDTAFVYFRTMAELQLKPGTTGSQFTAMLQKYQAAIVGGNTFISTYIVRYPDPGSTWAAYLARLDSLSAEPIVRSTTPMTRYEGKPLVESRFPTDGASLARADWLNAVSDTTWAMRAIRAPLAWGCETGEYGGAPVKVGVVEWAFDSTHPDLSTSRTSPVFVPSGASSNSLTLLEVAKYAYHGTAAAGLLSAKGDNDQGIAGVAWKTDLRLYHLGGNNAGVTFSTRNAFAQALEAATLDGIRVLSVSITIATPSNSATGPALQARLVETLQAFLDQNPNALVVIATGNENSRNLTASQLAGLRGPNALRAGLMTLKLQSPSYGDRILFVAGTSPGNTLWTAPPSGSNYFSGGTDIAAPGERVAILGSRNSGFTFSGPVVLDNGTSLSTPMVAGVAVQLLAMDPNLNAADLKSYITRGAQTERLDPTTGLNVPAQPVANAPGVYQLDAYGALSLLSKERPGTPICGINVRFEYPANDPHVILERNPGVVDTIPMPASFSDILSGSVAQGGRLFSITRDNGAGVSAVDEYALVSTQWGVRRTIDPLLARRYLEKDTADVAVDGNTATLRGSQWGASGTPIVMGTLAIPSLPSPGPVWFQFAPDGRHALFATTSAQPTCAQPIVIEQVWLVTLPAGPSYPVLGTGCNGTPGLRGVDGAWDQTGVQFAVGERDETGFFNVGSNYYSMTVANDQPVPNGPPVRVNGRSVIDYSFKQHMMDPIGVTATWFETGSAVVGDPTHGCYSVTRTTTSFAVVIDRFIPYGDPDWVALCQTPLQALSRRSPALSYRRH